MPDPVTLSLDSREFRRNLRKLSDVEIPRALARVLNKVGFEVLEAEKTEVKRSFAFAGPATERFLSERGAFFFKPASQTLLRVEISPRPKAGSILIEHEKGSLITAANKDRLVFGRQLAVPITRARLRGRTGRIPKRLLPGQLLSGKGRGFVAGAAILERRGGRGRGAKRGSNGASRVAALYALVPQAKLEPVFEFYNVAKGTARRQFSIKAKEVFAKLRASSR